MSSIRRGRKSEADYHRERANVLGVVAAGAPITPTAQVVLMEAAEAANRAAARAESAILDMSELSTPTEVKRARSRRAVRLGRDVFLPSWRDLCTGLPNSFLRSALWSVAAIGTALPSDSTSANLRVAAYGDVHLIANGPKLGSYDRRVFSACLDLYRDRPLFTEGSTGAVEISYYEFLRKMDVTYNRDSHTSLRASLKRLSAISLHMRTKGLELQLPRLIEASFADGEARSDRLLGSDLIYIRVMSSIAQLFGPSGWTAVPHEALTAGKGLKSWLATFYSSHSTPYPIQIDELYELSGATCAMPKFKYQLKGALTALQADSATPAVRIAKVEFGADDVTVHLARWEK